MLNHMKQYWHCTSQPVAPHLSEKGRVWLPVLMKDYHEFKRPDNQGGLWYLANEILIINFNTMQLQELFQRSVNLSNQLKLWEMQEPKLSFSSLIEEIDEKVKDIIILYSTEWNTSPTDALIGFHPTQLLNFETYSTVESTLVDYIQFLKGEVESLNSNEFYIADEVNDIIEKAVMTLADVKTL